MRGAAWHVLERFSGNGDAHGRAKDKHKSGHKPRLRVLVFRVSGADCCDRAGAYGTFRDWQECRPVEGGRNSDPWPRAWIRGRGLSAARPDSRGDRDSEPVKSTDGRERVRRHRLSPSVQPGGVRICKALPESRLPGFERETWARKRRLRGRKSHRSSAWLQKPYEIRLCVFLSAADNGCRGARYQLHGQRGSLSVQPKGSTAFFHGRNRSDSVRDRPAGR